MKKEMSIIQLFPNQLRGYFEATALHHEDLSEIRIRCMKPVLIHRGNQEFYLNVNGNECKVENQTNEDSYQDALCLNVGQVDSIFVHICQYSPYAYGEELRQGFITVAGGHRIGVAGQVLSQPGLVKSIRNVRFLNIRIAHEIKGAADRIMPYIYTEDAKDILNTLIIAPPGVGKTTLLRDIIRQVSDGENGKSPKTVGVVDERSEIAGCFLGEPQNDVGMRTDVLDACPKVFGMEIMLRSMAPQVIAVDEIATSEDVETLLMMMHCGVKVLATVHGENLYEIKTKRYLSSLFEAGCFNRFIILKQGRNLQVYNEKGDKML